jgi:hypothetical protein
MASGVTTLMFPGNAWLRASRGEMPDIRELIRVEFCKACLGREIIMLAPPFGLVSQRGSVSL